MPPLRQDNSTRAKYHVSYTDMLNVLTAYLDKLRVLTASTQAFLDNIHVEHGRPDNLLRTFDNNRVSSEKRSHDRGPSVVESYKRTD